MNRTVVGALLVCGLAMVGALSPAAAQLNLGPAVSLAETHTNAVAVGGTLNYYPLWPASWLALRGYVDAEWAWERFKPGLRYREPDRHLIENEQGVLQDPRNDLWDWPGFDLHASAYATVNYRRFGAGLGVAYNGHDGTSGLAGVLIFPLTPITEMDLEFLGGGRWRMRISVAWWWP